MVIIESNRTQIKHEESSTQTARREERSKEKFSTMSGSSLVVQALGLHALNAGGPGSIPGQGTEIPHTVTKSLNAVTKKIPHATTKIENPACGN